LQNLPEHVRRRVSKIIEGCDGDVDYEKLDKYANKKGWYN
jgi:hypothetical protein